MNQRVIWILLIVTFILTRTLIIYHQVPFPEEDDLFSVKRDRIRNSTYFVALDEAKYLRLARVFPEHRLFNTFYLTHPPLYPGFVSFMPDFGKDFAFRGVFLSWLSSLGLFAVFFIFARSFGYSGFTLLFSYFFLISFEIIRMYSQLIMKESFFLMLFVGALGCFNWSLRNRNKAALPCSMVMALCAVGTAEQGLFLVPLFFFLWYLHKPRAKIYFLSVPLFTGIAYTFWMALRYRSYSTNEFLSCGVDGTVEGVSNWSFQHLLNPHLFPFSSQVMGFRFEIDLFRIIYRLRELFEWFSPLSDYSYLFQLFFIIFLASWCLLLLRRLDPMKTFDLKNCDTSWQKVVFFLIYCAIALFPLLNRGTQARMMMTVLPVIALVLAECCRFWGNVLIKKKHHRDLVATALLIGMCSIMILSGLSRHHGFLFDLSFEFESGESAGKLKSLSPTLIIAQTGYPPELEYLTGIPVISLPQEPFLLEKLLEDNDNVVLLFGHHYLSSPDEDSLTFCIDTIHYIRSHQEKFLLLQRIPETYQTVNWPDIISLYKPLLPTRKGKECAKE